MSCLSGSLRSATRGRPRGVPVDLVTMLRFMLHGAAACQWKPLKMLGTICNMAQHEKTPPREP